MKAKCKDRTSSVGFKEYSSMYEENLNSKMADSAKPLEAWRFIKLGDISDIDSNIPDKRNITDNLEVKFLPMKLAEELTGKIRL